MITNALSVSSNVSVICYRKLLPEFLFPGRAHIGKKISSLEFTEKVRVFDGMDYDNPITWYKAYRHLKISKSQIIVLQWWTSSVSHMHFLLKIMSILLNSKLVIEFHEVLDPLEESFLPLRIYSRIMGRLLRRNVKTYITHSETDKKLVAVRYGIDHRNIHVIPHGLYDQYEIIDRNIARKELLIKEKFIILSFGLVRKYKGIPYLIDAFEKLPQDIIQNSKLMIVGEVWEEKKELIDSIKLSPFKEKITLVDRYVTDKEVSLYFSAADIIVMPYLRVSQSGIAHIAMSFGKPIIVSEISGLKESMGNYPGAFFVPPGNSDAIQREIIKQFGRQKVYNPTTTGWNTISKQYLNIISAQV